MTIKTLFLAIPFLLLGVSSCKKNVAGPKGDPGADGKKGNIKQSTRTFTVSASTWSLTLGSYTAKVYFPEIANQVIEKGEVKVYMKIGTQWWGLPHVVGDVTMHQAIEYQYLHVKYSKIHGSPSAPPGDVTFRAVVYSPY